jgi:hypothetical protein
MRVDAAAINARPVTFDRIARSALAIVLLATGGIAAAAQCSAKSAEHRVPLLELYTSEGCDSCPPADRWFGALPTRGLTPERVVALAFHVDYWNDLGWKDPFSKAEYSARQRAASVRNKARFVYTPQFLLDGRDYRRGIFRDDFTDRVSAISREEARATIRLDQVAEAEEAVMVHGTVAVTDAAQRQGARAYVALYENKLSNRITAGENRGKHLQHDFVVRELSPPQPAGPDGKVVLQHRFDLDPRWKRGDLHIAAFVQNERTGEILQAMAVRVCR